MLREVLYFEDVIYRLESLTVYSRIAEDEVFVALSELASVIAANEKREIMTSKYYVFAKKLLATAEEFGFSGHLLRQYVLYLYLQDCNPLSLACNNGVDVSRSTLYSLALRDMGVLQYFMGFDLQNLCENAGYGENLYDYTPTRLIEYPEIDQLAEKQSAEDLLQQLIWHYVNIGCGDMADTEMFRVNENGEFEPIRNTRTVLFSSFTGYERQIDELKANTEAFLAGQPAGTLLLSGSAGIGKYACMNALADQYFDRGLRVVEIGKDKFCHIKKLLAALGRYKNKFILAADDLSNEDVAKYYDDLKYCLGTSLEACPKNVLFYAVSNRNSPAAYFDEVIVFSEMTKREFQDAAAAIAKKMNLQVPVDFLREQALEWVADKQERSAATAREFVKQVAWELKKV